MIRRRAKSVQPSDYFSDLFMLYPKSQAEDPDIIYEGEPPRRHAFETDGEQAASTARQREVLPPGLTPSKKGRQASL